jgi:hypothetical protein
MKLTVPAIAVAAAMLATIAVPAAAQAPPPEAARQALDALMRLADEAAAKGLPSAPLANKILEGRSKGVDSARIESVVRQMSANLEAADGLVREIEPAASGVSRDAAVVLLGEALGAGITTGDVRELRRQAQPAGRPAPAMDAIAGAARGLASIKEARLSASEGTAVMAEALLRGYRSHEMRDLGRDIKRREGDFQAGRTTLAAMREAIARGERPERAVPVRPARPESVVDRPAAATRPERPAPERPARPERPERPPTGR